MDYETTKDHILYQVIDENDNIVYIGSSGLPIKSLEYNHRHWSEKGYTGTRFRRALITEGQTWTFEILHKSHCSRERIETLEGLAIREALPKYNDDFFPLESSRNYGRI